MFNLLIEWYRSWRLRRASNADISDDVCISCESADITSLAPNVYVCNACGYEGGSGHATLRKQQRLAQFDALSPEQRRESAAADLLQARHLLLSGIGYFDSTASFSRMDIIGFDDVDLGAGEGSEKLSDFVQGAKLLQEAQTLLEDATYKLQQHPGGEISFDGEIDYSAWIFDLHFDNLFSDLRSHLRILEAQGQAQSVLAAVEHSLQTHFGRRDL